MEKALRRDLTTKTSGRDWLLFFSVLGFMLPLVSILVYLVHVTNSFVLYDSGSEIALKGSSPPPFPIGVDPEEKIIAELPHVETYLDTELKRTTDVSAPETIVSSGFLRKIVSKLALFEWYQNLAAGASRVIVIQPGERKEQIAMNLAKILGWTEEEKREFLVQIVSSDPILLEGKFSPGTYIVAGDAQPSNVAPLVIRRFNDEVFSRYPTDLDAKVPLHDALTIASLLEREAYDFEDMRHIAGVIWNRLFVDMNLQIDATLQYAKGTDAPKTWWPTPVPNDKFIDSPYNTYQHSGLPPTPIANPSVDAILAALNPRETECMYYFHDADSQFHCTKTYEEHVALLKKYYGRGR